MSDDLEFDGYYVRPCGERDREYLEDLIENDPWHRDKMTADEFLNLMPGEQAFVVENEQGFAMLYFKTATAVRLTLQFVTTRNAEDRARNRGLLMKGMEWLEGRLRGRFREIITETDGPALTMMVKKRLGFQEVKNQLSRLIPPVPTVNAPNGAWQGVPQADKTGEG
jgi:hypothetical protein